MNLILFRYILKHFVLIFFATLFALATVILLFEGGITEVSPPGAAEPAISQMT